MIANKRVSTFKYQTKMIFVVTISPDCIMNQKISPVCQLLAAVNNNFHENKLKHLMINLTIQMNLMIQQ